MFEINPGLIVWTLLTFILLMIVLRIFAWKPLLSALNRREEHVRNSVERAELAKREAERLLEENRRQLREVEHEGRRILNESREIGEKIKIEMVEKANQQSQRMINQAKLEIERDKEAALTELRAEVVTLAIQAAEKILDETIDSDRNRKIVDSFLQKL